MAQNTERDLVDQSSCTTSGNSGDFTVEQAGMGTFFLDVSAASGTPTLDVTVKGKDPASGGYFTLGSFTQATAVTSEAIVIGGPADTEILCRTMRVEWVVGGTTPSFDFTVGVSLHEE